MVDLLDNSIHDIPLKAVGKTRIRLTRDIIWFPKHNVSIIPYDILLDESSSEYPEDRYLPLNENEFEVI